MAKRKNIALIFSYNEGWIGGAYYIINLVHALKTLPQNLQPRLLICASLSDFSILKDETNYPFIKHYDTTTVFKLPFIKRVLNRINKNIFGSYLFDSRPNHLQNDFVYPVTGFPQYWNNLMRKVFWIPDFQEKYYPQYFSSQELLFRDQSNKSILYGNKAVVFSSQSARNDSLLYFPENNAQSFVLPFAVTLPKFDMISISTVKEKYDLPDRYFFCPNQFWQHKNHLTVLKAVLNLKKEGVLVTVLFSGKEEDHRNKDFVQSLKQYCFDEQLGDSVRFLGFLDRKEQLCILENSILIIQPSQFEGWSTVVEDCKALNKFMLVSDLAVHKEQISENCEFFESLNADSLALLMKNYHLINPVTKTINYQSNVQDFATSFLALSEQIKQL